MALNDRLDPKYLEFLRNGKPLDELIPTDETGIPVPTPVQMGGKEFRYDDLSNLDAAQNTVNQGILRNFPESQKAIEIAENPIQRSMSAYNESSNGRDTDAIKAFFDKQKKDEAQSSNKLNTSLNMPDLKELTSAFPNSPQRPTILGNPNYEQDYTKYNDDVVNQKKSSNQFLEGLLSKKDETPLMLQGIPEELRKSIDDSKDISNITQNKLSSTQNSSTKSISNNALKSGTPEISEVSNKVPSVVDDFEKQQELARQQDNEHNLLFGLLKAAQMGGSALAGTKANTEFADAELSKNNEMTNQLKTNMDLKEEHQNILDKNRMRDPNSDISKQARAMLAEVYPELLKKYPNISAAEMDKMGVNMGQLASVKENIASRKETTRMHNETLALARSNKKEQKGTEVAGNHIDTYTKMLYKDYQGVQQAETNAKRAKDIVANNIAGVTPGAGDIAILYNFIKGLDKDSAVREGEIGLSKQARSVLGRLDSEVKRIQGGDLLDQATREAFAELIDASSKAERLNFVKQKRNAIAAGVQKGIDPDILDKAIFADVSTVAEPVKSTTISKGQKIPLTGKGVPGRTFTHEGKDYKVDPDGTSATEI